MLKQFVFPFGNKSIMVLALQNLKYIYWNSRKRHEALPQLFVIAGSIILFRGITSSS